MKTVSRWPLENALQILFNCEKFRNKLKSFTFSSLFKSLSPLQL
jgi:hypothetical protein